MNKKIFSLIVLTAMCIGAQAQIQNLHQGEQAIVYYMPKTEIAIHVTYIEETYTAGPFAAYAEKLLGLQDVREEDEVTRRFDHVETGTRTTADLDRAYKVVAEKGIDLQLLAINDKGILEGYNISPSPALPKGKEHVKTKPAPAPHRFAMPLTEDGLSAESEEDRAMAAMEQILHLRESRLSLLCGKIMPADGLGIEAMLSEIEKQEQALVALFAGHRSFRTVTETLYYTPTETTEAEVGEFILTIETMPEIANPAVADKNNKKAPQPSPICYNLPGRAHYTLRLGDRIVAERTIEVAQLGVAIPLTRDLFTPGRNTHIYFSTKTGNVKAIQ